MPILENIEVHATEKAIHDIILEMVQKIKDETDININSIDIDWFEMMGGKDIIYKVNIRSSKRG